MKLSISVMMYSALAATIMAYPDCSLNKVREVIENSCSLPRGRRHLSQTPTNNNDPIFDLVHRFKSNISRLPKIPLDAIPPNMTVKIVRRQKRRQHKRHLYGSDPTYVYEVCCKDIKVCQLLLCP